MDWSGLREALALLRERRGCPDTELARRAGINRQTVARIEDVQRDPGYEPRLSTIEAWLLALDAGPVSAFLRPYEQHTGNTGDVAPPTRDYGRPGRTSTVASLQEVLGESRTQHARPARLDDELADLAGVLRRLADPTVTDQLGRAIATALAQSLASSAEPKPPRTDPAGD